MIQSTLMKLDVDSVGMAGVLEDSNAPERVDQTGWTGERSKLWDYNRAVVKDEITPNLKIPRCNMTWAKSLVGLIYSGGLLDQTDNTNWFDVKHDNLINTITYADCLVNTFKLSGSSNSPVEFELGLIGTTARAFGATGGTTTATHATPIVMSDATFSVGATAYKPSAFELEINQNLETFFDNQLTVEEIGNGELTVTGSLELTVDATMWAALLADCYQAGTSKALEIVLTVGTESITIDCDKIGIVDAPPAIPETGQWRGSVNFEAYVPTTGDIVDFTLV